MIQRYPSALIRNTIVTMLLAVLLCGNSLIRVAISAKPAVPASDLPADGIYPQGRKLAFAGYSGDPARDLANGFTLASPMYGDQQPYPERCFANDWPVIAHIGPNTTFNDQASKKYKLDPASLRQEVEQQIKALAVHKQIACWAVRPEELRPCHHAREVAWSTEASRTGGVRRQAFSGDYNTESAPTTSGRFSRISYFHRSSDSKDASSTLDPVPPNKMSSRSKRPWTMSTNRSSRVPRNRG